MQQLPRLDIRRYCCIHLPASRPAYFQGGGGVAPRAWGISIALRDAKGMRKPSLVGEATVPGRVSPTRRTAEHVLPSPRSQGVACSSTGAALPPSLSLQAALKGRSIGRYEPCKGTRAGQRWIRSRGAHQKLQGSRVLPSVHMSLAILRQQVRSQRQLRGGCYVATIQSTL